MKRLFAPVVITILWAVLQGCASTPSISSISSSDEVWCLKLNEVSWITKASCESYWGEELSEKKMFSTKREADAYFKAVRARSKSKHSVKTPSPTKSFYYCPGCNLDDIDLHFRNLVGANLVGANLERVRLIATNLSEADLSGANLMGVRAGVYREADNPWSLRSPVINPYWGRGVTDPVDDMDAEMKEARMKLRKAAPSKFINANFTGVNLYDADLNGADLTGANLTGADLSHANLTDVDLSRANLTGATLEGTTFCNTTMPDGTVNNSDC